MLLFYEDNIYIGHACMHIQEVLLAALDMITTFRIILQRRPRIIVCYGYHVFILYYIFTLYA